MFSIVVSNSLQRKSIQIALLLGIFSAVVAAETVNTRWTTPNDFFQQLPSVPSQPADGWALIKTSDGALFVWNAQDLHFTVAVKGKEIKQVPDPDHIFLAVDGNILQIQATAIREFAPNAKEKQLDDKALLATHRDWESKYIEGLLKSKLTLHSFSVNISSLGAGSLWEYDMPAGMNAEVKTQLYVTLVRGDFVVMLNAEATTTITEVEARKFLLDTMATLTTSSETIDVHKLSESIRTGRKP